MRSPYQTDIVGKRRSRPCIELTRCLVGGPERESRPARSRSRADRDARKIRQYRIHALHPQLRPGEELVGNLLHPCPRFRHPKGINRIGAEQVGIAYHTGHIAIQRSGVVEGKRVLAVIGARPLQIGNNIAPEHALFLAYLVIHPHNPDALVTVPEQPVSHLAALIDGRRQKRGDLHGRRIQHGRRDRSYS